MRLLILLFFLFLVRSITAQSITILHETTLEPVGLVSIYSDDKKTSTLTNEQGEAKLNGFKKESYLNFQRIGFEIVRVSMEDLANNGYIVFLPPNRFNLGELVVSANKWEQDRNELANPITVLGQKEIQFQNPQTSADLLEGSNKVYVQKSQFGGGSPMIRGFATNRVLLIVDGVRMNNSILRSGNVHNLISLDPMVVDEVEILFGPGSVTYGSDAIGGVMSFKTKEPLFSLTKETEVKAGGRFRYSSVNQEKTGSMMVEVRKSRISSITSFSISDFEDLKMGSNNGIAKYRRTWYQQNINQTDSFSINSDDLVQRNTGFESKAFLQKLKWQPGKYSTINYSLYYAETGNIPRYDRLIHETNNRPTYSEWNYGPQKWLTNNVLWVHNKSQRMYDQLKVLVYSQLFEESRIDRRYKSPLRRTREESVNIYGFNIDLKKTYSKKLTLFYGVESVTNRNHSEGTILHTELNTSNSINARYPNGLWNSEGIYSNLKHRINDKLIFSAGVRVSWIHTNANFDTTLFPYPFSQITLNNIAPNGSVGLVYLLKDNNRLTFNLSTGFRAPNIDDIGKVFDSEPGIIIVPNEGLKPEYAYNFDMGYEGVLGENFLLNIGGFGTYLKNAMVRRNFSLNGLDSMTYDGVLSQIQAIQNKGFAYVVGGVIGGRYLIGRNWWVGGTVNYQMGKEVDQNLNYSIPLRHVAPLFGRAELAYKNKGFRCVIDVAFNGAVTTQNLHPTQINSAFLYAEDQNGNPFAPSWYTVNLKSTYKPNPYLSVSGGIDNILDLQYRTYASGIVAPGRNFFLTLAFSVI